MAITPSDIARLEADFKSGRNPLAYIPLCQALRRTKRYARALEVCSAGLRGDKNSVAGRTLYCRLLGDLGRYQDAFTELEKALKEAPDSMGLLTEKARSMFRAARLPL